MYKILLILSLKLHNFLYKVISYLSIKNEGGLHPKYRLIKYKDFFLNNIKENESVLDIGCGQGALAYDISKKAKSVVGVDFDLDKINFAKEKYKDSSVNFLCADATKDLKNEKFDVIVMSNVLEHIEHRVEFLKSIHGLANKYLFRVPMIDRDWVPLYKKELGLEWRLDLTHFTEFTFAQFKDEFEQAGYRIDFHTVQFGEIWAIIYPN